MNFPCVQCGICCKKVNTVLGFQHFDDGNGVCCYLENNLCSIYKDRPVSCNSEKFYEAFYKDRMTECEFAEKILRICHDLIVESGNKCNIEKIEKAIEDFELKKLSNESENNGKTFKRRSD
ncbi:hypothetical protein AGMMS50276_00490 [Synergistales bacterium]|nr:hypothetical protein AGMMS50276_00490 [Synergistales bacterium]